MVLSDTIITLLIASTSGLLGLALKLCYSSKCKNFKLCCLSIDRDTEHEVSINMESPARI